ncbi:MAG: MAPEG family protein [Pseudomonadales bacterium]|nr:MAPEG family protein [Pseudomonadales bacterium]
MVWFNIYVFINIALITALAFNISRLRISEKVANGDGGNLIIKKAIRAHLNAIEHVLPFGLLILALSRDKPSSTLPMLVCAFSIARVLHAVSMLKGNFNLRRFAAVSSYALEVLAVVILGFKIFI